jgi:hypothetical protein
MSQIPTTLRLMPPAGRANTITVNGRSYTCAFGSTIDVPQFDAAVMVANHWVVASPGGVGATAARPAAKNRSDQFQDTTTGGMAVWDGLSWRDCYTGAAV